MKLKFKKLKPFVLTPRKVEAAFRRARAALTMVDLLCPREVDAEVSRLWDTLEEVEGAVRAAVEKATP